jgi:hypothetical protein
MDTNIVLILAVAGSFIFGFLNLLKQHIVSYWARVAVTFLLSALFGIIFIGIVLHQGVGITTILSSGFIYAVSQLIFHVGNIVWGLLNQKADITPSEVAGDAAKIQQEATGVDSQAQATPAQ